MYGSLCVRGAAYCQAYLYSSPGHSSSHLAVCGLCPSRGLCGHHQKSVCGSIIKTRSWEQVCVMACSLLAWGTDTGFQTTQSGLALSSSCKIDHMSNYTCPPRGWRDGQTDGWMNGSNREMVALSSLLWSVAFLTKVSAEEEWKRVTSRYLNWSSVDRCGQSMGKMYKLLSSQPGRQNRWIKQRDNIMTEPLEIFGM